MIFSKIKELFKGKMKCEDITETVSTENEKTDAKILNHECEPIESMDDSKDTEVDEDYSEIRIKFRDGSGNVKWLRTEEDFNEAMEDVRGAFVFD